jgi:predicted small lipoprotein YifL
MTRLPWLSAAAGLLVGLALGTACGAKGPLPRDSDVEPPISVDRISDHPEQFLGERVRLAAHVAEQLGSRIFTLKDEDPVRKEQILVVTRRSLSRLLAEERTTLKPGERVLVSGVIRRCDVAEVEAELAVDLDPKLEERFRGKPMLVASEVVRTDDAAGEAEGPDTLTPPNH